MVWAMLALENKDFESKVIDAWFWMCFELEHGMVWEMNEWVLSGYWLMICMRPMMGCFVIGNEKKEKVRKEIGRWTKIRVIGGWKALND